MACTVMASVVSAFGDCDRYKVMACTVMASVVSACGNCGQLRRSRVEVGSSRSDVMTIISRIRCKDEHVLAKMLRLICSAAVAQMLA